MKKLLKIKIATILIMTPFCSFVFAEEPKALQLVLPSDYFSFGFYNDSLGSVSLDNISLQYNSSSVDLESNEFYASADFFVKWTIASRSRIKITMNVSEWNPNTSGGGKVSFVSKISGSGMNPITSGNIVVTDLPRGSVTSGVAGYTAAVSMKGIQYNNSYTSTVVMRVEVSE